MSSNFFSQISSAWSVMYQLILREQSLHDIYNIADMSTGVHDKLTPYVFGIKSNVIVTLLRIEWEPVSLTVLPFFFRTVQCSVSSKDSTPSPTGDALSSSTTSQRLHRQSLQFSGRQTQLLQKTGPAPRNPGRTARPRRTTARCRAVLRSWP